LNNEHALHNDIMTMRQLIKAYLKSSRQWQIVPLRRRTKKKKSK